MSATPVPGSWFIIILFVGAALLAMGLYLLYRGLRGRRVGDHPHCRRCRFDLSGTLPQRKDCPECGAEVSRADAVQIGLHERRPGFIIAGAAMLLLAMGTVALPMVGRVRQINWQPYKPVWWLRMDAKAVTGPTADAAWDELLRRQKANLLSRDTQEQLVALVLALQADTNQQWNIKAGALVEQAEQTGVLTAEQLERYLTTMLDQALDFTIRPEIRLGDPWPYRIAIQRPRAGPGTFFCNINLIALTLEKGQVTNRGTSFGFSTGGNHGGGACSSVISADRIPSSVTPGRHALSCSFNVRVDRDWQGKHQGTPPLLECVVRREATCTVLPADQATVQAIDDPALMKTIQAAVTVHRLFMESRRDDQTVRCELQITPRPVGVAYRVELHDGDRRIHLGSFAAPASQSTQWNLSGGRTDKAAELLGRRVKIVLTPDLQAALQTVDVTDYWNHPLVIEDVEVTEPK